MYNMEETICFKRCIILKDVEDMYIFIQNNYVEYNVEYWINYMFEKMQKIFINEKDLYIILFCLLLINLFI